VRIIQVFFILIGLLLSVGVFAKPPVINMMDSNNSAPKNPSPFVSNKPVDDANNTQNGAFVLAAKIQQLQQSMQDLRGIVEVQAHSIKQLETQVRNLYADLDRRIAKLSSSPANDAATVVAATDIQEPAPVDEQSKKTANVVATPEEMKLFNEAFATIKSKQYSSAITKLLGYLKKYPSGKYVAESHYWLGELYTISGYNDKASTEFNMVVNDYADSNKAPDALLKLGSMVYDQSQFDQAKQFWTTITDKYPSSAAARVAKTRLQALERR